MDIMIGTDAPEESGARLCCGCLSTDRRLIPANPYSDLFSELTHLQLWIAAVPPWLCWECAAGLQRAVRFRRKLLHSHALLQDYASRCAPFPMDVADKELLGLACPTLSAAATLAVTFDTKRGRTGFHPPLTHHGAAVPPPAAPPPPSPPADCDVKEECAVSDYDDMTLEEYKLQDLCAAPAAEEAAEVGAEAAGAEVKAEPAEEPPPRRRKRKEKRRHERKKRIKLEEVEEPVAEGGGAVEEVEGGERAPRVRRAVDVDPAKIRMVLLDPVEQVRARAEAAAAAGLLRFPFKCELCYRGFNFEAKLHNHMKKHDPARGKFECKLCSMFLPTIYSYNVHMLTHTTRYECLQCGKQMIDRGCIVEHYEAVHEGKVQHYTCRLCGKVSLNSKTHRGHMRNHHSGERPGCDQCGKTFVNRDSLSEHILIHQGVKNHECDKCGVRFRTKTQLKHHQLKHTSAREFYCVECDVRFKSAHNLRQHLSKSRRHVDTDSLQYACARCPRRFATARALQHHVSFGHEGRRLHTCAECGAQLATSNSLAKHTRSAHRGYRAPLKHVCDTCGKAFRGKNVLVNHVRTHTGEKPYECGECFRKFSQRTAMRTHVKLVHLKIKRGAKLPDPLPHKVEASEYEPWAEPERAPVVYFLPDNLDH